MSFSGFDVIKLEQPDHFHLILTGESSDLNHLLTNLNVNSYAKSLRLTIILNDQKLHNQMHWQEQLLHYPCPIQLIPINNQDSIRKFIQIQRKMAQQSNNMLKFQSQIQSEMALTKQSEAMEQFLTVRFGWTRRRIAKMIDEQGVNSFEKLLSYGNLNKQERQILMKVNRIAQI